MNTGIATMSFMSMMMLMLYIHMNTNIRAPGINTDTCPTSIIGMRINDAVSGNYSIKPEPASPVARVRAEKG
jgi:hypothetical protein